MKMNKSNKTVGMSPAQIKAECFSICDSPETEKKQTMLCYVGDVSNSNIERSYALLYRTRSLIDRLNVSGNAPANSASAGSSVQENLGLLQQLMRDQEKLSNILEDLTAEIAELESLL